MMFLIGVGIGAYLIAGVTAGVLVGQAFLRNERKNYPTLPLYNADYIAAGLIVVLTTIIWPLGSVWVIGKIIGLGVDKA